MITTAYTLQFHVFETLTESTFSSSVQAQLGLKLTKMLAILCCTGTCSSGWMVTNGSPMLSTPSSAIGNAQYFLSRLISWGLAWQKWLLAASVTVFGGLCFQAREVLVRHRSSFFHLPFLGHPVALVIVI